MKITKFAELQHVYNVINIPSLIFLEEDIWPLIRPWERAADSSLLLLEDLIYINILVPSCVFFSTIWRHSASSSLCLHCVILVAS